MLELSVLVFAACVNIALGLTVFLKNSRSVTNRLFLMLTNSFVAWTIVNYFSVHPVGLPQLEWIRLVLFFAAFLCLSVYLTFDVFPYSRLSGSSIRRQLAVLATIIVMALTLTPLVFKGVSVEHGSVHTIPNGGIGLFALLVVSLLGGGVYTIIRKYHQAEGSLKQQLRFILFGVGGTFGLILFSNFLLVVAFNNTRLVSFGPAYTLVFTGFFTYAVVKHKLFDIKLFAVRAAAYLFSVVLLSLLYIVPSILLVAFIIRIQFTWPRFFTGLGVALSFALFYGPVRTRFNNLTNKLFFRGYYEPQEVLDRLSEMLVRSIDADYIKHQSMRILQTAVKTKQFTYSLPSGVEGEQQTYELLVGLFGRRAASNVLVVDEYEGSAKILQYVKDEGIALVVRLRTADNVLGFLALGYKESGEMYSEKDKRLLSIAADEIAISLQNALHFQEIQDFNRTLQAKIQEATKELRRSNEKLKELDETKDDFISMASHQLRTPLTSVKGYLSMVLEGDAGKLTPMQRKMLGQAYISSQRMVYLIADLLNVSRLKTGKFIIDSAPTNLAIAVDEEIQQVTEMAEARGITLTYQKPREFPTLMLDETKTRQVVMNFIDNAIYYTPQGGHIEVQLIDKPLVVELRVVDDGIGVPKSEQHHLFTKFYRAGNARKARPDGTGLGLFMAKKVILAQGGSIVFESKEGKGSTFGFAFPKSKLHVPETVGGPRETMAPLAK